MGWFHAALTSTYWNEIRVILTQCCAAHEVMVDETKVNSICWKQWICRDCPLADTYPPKDTKKIVSGSLFFRNVPGNNNKNQLNSSILLCSFFQSWIEKLGSRADQINSDLFCKENHVKTMCTSFSAWCDPSTFFRGKCSKNQILANEVWLGSVGACFEKSNSVRVCFHSQRLEVLVNEAVHKMCSTPYPILCDHRILNIFTSNFTQQPHIWWE